MKRDQLAKTLVNRPSAWMWIGIAAVIVVLIGGFWAVRNSALPRNEQTSVQSGPVTDKISATVTNGPLPVKTRLISDYLDFKMRPLPVGIESTHCQWVLADGKDTNIIRQLAHNPLEYARMVDENSRIFRRQLVYLKETAASVFEQAKLTGSPVTQLTLPGVDGQELTFEIARREGGGSSRQGMFSGHLVGNTDSLVTMAFEDGREAFTVLSPKDNVFLVAEPRENGQIIVKAIDPNTYGIRPVPSDIEDVVKTAAVKN